MSDPKIFLIVLMVLLVCASSSASRSYFTYPKNFPIVILSDFMYIPTDYGYKLTYRTQAGVTHEELGIVPGLPSLRNNDNDDNDNSNSNSDTLGSSKAGRQKSKRLPFKSRKVSPKLLASLSG